MKLAYFSFLKIQYYIAKFEKAENALEGISFVQQILVVLKKNGEEDERLNEFLNKLLNELNFNFFESNWKKFDFYFPEMDSYYSVNKYMFMESQLKEKVVTNNETAWDRLQKRIIATFDEYENMFGQMVPLQIT